MQTRTRSRSRSRTPFKKSVDPKASTNKTKVAKNPELSPEKTAHFDSESQVSSKSGHPNKKSYLEIIKEFIDTHDAMYPIQEVMGNFSLIEDLKIIYEMAKDDKEQSHLSVFWKNLANGILKRNVESIRSRYKGYLKFLEKDDFDHILEHLKASGVHGYWLKFGQLESKKRKLIEISVDEKLKSSSSINVEKQVQQIVVEEGEKKIEKKVPNFFEKKTNKDPQNTENFIQSKRDSQWITHITKYQEVIKNNTLSVESKWKEKRIFNEKKMDEEEQKNANTIVVTSDFKERWVMHSSEDVSIKELDVRLEKLQKQYGVDKDTLVQAMYTVSGDLEDLVKLLENPSDEIIKWSKEDDQALDECKSESDKSFLILMRYKGKERIIKRLEFLNKSLPFALG